MIDERYPISLHVLQSPVSDPNVSVSLVVLDPIFVSFPIVQSFSHLELFVFGYDGTRFDPLEGGEKSRVGVRLREILEVVVDEREGSGISIRSRLGSLLRRGKNRLGRKKSRGRKGKKRGRFERGSKGDLRVHGFVERRVLQCIDSSPLVTFERRVLSVTLLELGEFFDERHRSKR